MTVSRAIAVCGLLLVSALLAVVLRPAQDGGARAAVKAPPQADAETFTLTWGGDVTLGSSYGQPPAQGWPLLAPVASILRAADIAAVNLEGTLGRGGASKCGGGGGGTCFAFQAPAANARSLRRAGVDIVNHANNHAFDFGPLGWRASRDALKAAKVAATGAPGEITVVKRGDTTFAFAGFSTYSWTSRMDDDAKVRVIVEAAAKQADVVVAFFHAGAEGADQAHVPRGPESAFGEFRGNSRHFARVAIDAGADLVLGSGPHVLRGMELYKGRLIAYSLGNLAGYHNFATGGLSGLSALLTVVVTSGGRFVAGRVDSLTLDGAALPHRDAGGQARRLIANLTRSDFGGGGVRFDGPVMTEPQPRPEAAQAAQDLAAAA
jgi:poly-gamma-glutamate capsule biosynthesis protein CapA/YwtB (metallophosphatase superfamily)